MTPYQTWWLATFLAMLDEAGYAIVRKPELLGHGLPSRR